MSDPEGEGALGSWVHGFSRLIFSLRFWLPQVALANLPKPLRYGPANASFFLISGGMGASQLADAFFGVAETAFEYEPEELEMARWIRNRLTPLIKVRNDFLHGEWMIGAGRMAAGGVWTTAPPTLSRTNPGSKSSKATRTEYPVEKLREEADKVKEAHGLVSEWGRIVARQALYQMEGLPADKMAIARPKDVYVMRGRKADRRLFREGPLAGVVPLIAAP